MLFVFKSTVLHNIIKSCLSISKVNCRCLNFIHIILLYPVGHPQDDVQSRLTVQGRLPVRSGFAMGFATGFREWRRGVVGGEPSTTRHSICEQKRRLNEGD